MPIAAIAPPSLNNGKLILEHPKCGRKYSNDEILSFAVLHGSKNKIIPAIQKSSYGPSGANMYECFPKNGTPFDDNTIRRLLAGFEPSQRGWLEQVHLISIFDHGQSETYIHHIFGYSAQRRAVSPETVPLLTTLQSDETDIDETDVDRSLGILGKEAAERERV